MKKTTALSNLELKASRRSFYTLMFAILFAGIHQLGAATYTLGTSTLLERPTAGSDSITLAVSPNASAWTATTNNPWLHLSAPNQAGTGSTNIIFSYDANAGLTRTGTLAISGQTLNIIQAGSNYVAATGPVAMVVSNGLNLPFSIAVSSAGNIFIADYGNNAIKKWTRTNNLVATIVTTGLLHPSGVAVDGAGNLYIADSGHGTLKKWNAANSNVTTLATGLATPFSVALDTMGNVYVSETGNTGANTVDKWSIANSNVTTVVGGFGGISGVAVDIAGNVYIADQLNGTVTKWSAANSSLTTLVPLASGFDPNAVAVDGSGNVYFTAPDNSSTFIGLWKWVATSNTVVPVVTLGTPPSSLNSIGQDSAGNFFMCDTASNNVRALQVALVDPTAKFETAAGTDVLSAVLPASQTFSPLFAPTSDQPWLTISGVTNGITTFAFTLTTSNRTAHINLVGKSITITQSNTVAVTPPLLITPKFVGNSFQFAFSNNQGATFSVLATTNLATPLTNWSLVGTPTNNGSGLFQFSLPATNTDPRRFFRVRAN